MLTPSLLFATVMISSCPSTLAFSPTQPYSGHHAKSFTPSAVGAINLDMRSNKQNKLSIQIASKRAYSIHAMASTNNPDNEEEGEGDKKKSTSDEIFWAKQRAFAAQLSANSDAGQRKEMKDAFTKRRLALVSDTLYFSILIGSLLWLVSPNPFVTLSYIFGALAGTAYSYGLGKFVETIGGSIDDVDVEGSGVGQARFAFLILLFVVVGKFRSQGLLEIPSIMGFFTYQLASLGQGLREIED